MTRQVQEDILDVARDRILEVVRRETGLDESAALKMAAEILVAFRHEFGGAEVYFRKVKYDIKAVIADMRCGVGYREVCRRHGLSERTYRRLLSKYGVENHACSDSAEADSRRKA